MEVKIIISKIPLVCSRCQDIGITEPTIRVGDAYVSLAMRGACAACCIDCWNRLADEVDNGLSEWA